MALRVTPRVLTRIKEYGVTLSNYPVLNMGSSTNPSYFPAEFLEIQPGQSVKAKLTGVETTDMLSFACRKPSANAFSITTDGRETLGLDDGGLVCPFHDSFFS